MVLAALLLVSHFEVGLDAEKVVLILLSSCLVVAQIYFQSSLCFLIRREWPSSVRHYIKNRRDSGSNPTRCSALGPTQK